MATLWDFITILIGYLDVCCTSWFLDFSLDEIIKCDHQLKATKQYFPVVLFIILCKVLLIFESQNEVLKCDHSDESY